MRVLVAGAASALGLRVCTLLRSEGHEVLGITRGDGLALRAAGVSPVRADLLSESDVRAAVLSAEPQAIVWTVNALPKAGPAKFSDIDATNRVRAIGVPQLVAAARDAGVTRFVCESLSFAYGSRSLGSAPVTEDAAFASNLPNPSLQAGIDAVRTMESAVLSAGGVALRMGAFYGPGVGSTQDWIRRLRKRRLPAIRGVNGLYPFVHIDDAAAAVVAALEHGTPGAAYNVCDDRPVTFAEAVTAIAEATGAPRPRVMPHWMLRFAGKYLAMLLQGNLPLSNEKAKAELGWKPHYPTIAEGARSLRATSE